MDIRPASIADLPAIQALIEQYPDKLLQDHLPEPEAFFVAIDGEKIIGCCALEVYSKRLAEVRSLAVAEDFQSSGVGSALIERCITAAKEKGVYEILTITGATGLFERQGFGTFKNEKYALIKVVG